MSRAEYPPEYDEPQGDIDYEDSDEHYVGDAEGNGCSYLVGKCRCCGAFHIHVWWEDNHTVDNLVKDDGPYATEEAALTAAKDASIEWCANNEVNFEDAVADREDE